jgi:hypothetical protein
MSSDRCSGDSVPGTPYVFFWVPAECNWDASRFARDKTVCVPVSARIAISNRMADRACQVLCDYVQRRRGKRNGIQQNPDVQFNFVIPVGRPGCIPVVADHGVYHDRGFVGVEGQELRGAIVMILIRSPGECTRDSRGIMCILCGIPQGDSAMTSARRQLIDVAVARWYHSMSRCVRGASLLRSESSDRKATQ